MAYPLSAYIALRYSTAGKHNSFVAFINRFSVAGIALGLMSLIIVLSVMNGFEAQLRQRILGIVPQVVAHNASVEDVLQLPSLEFLGSYLTSTQQTLDWKLWALEVDERQDQHEPKACHEPELKEHCDHH